MKKSLYFAIAAALCMTGGIAYEKQDQLFSSKEESASVYSKGSEVVAKVREQYKAGDFDNFLKEMDSVYASVVANGQLEDYSQMRLGSEINLQWLDAVKNLQVEKNQQLTNAVSGESSVFSEKVMNVATFTDTDPFIFNLHQKKLGQGKNQDENTLIQIDMEYEVKGLNLDMLPNDSKFKSMDLQVLQYVLKMEQADKMLLASQSFSDQDLVGSVEKFAAHLDRHLSVSYDSKDLYSLTKDQAKAHTTAEKNVAFVLQNHQEKLSQSAEKIAP